MKVNLGCGHDYRLGWLNIDLHEAANPDMVVDLEQTPWPLESDSADFILLKDVLPQLGRDGHAFLSIMSELYRIAKPGAVIEIYAPHPTHRDFLLDPTHMRPIVPEMFKNFDLAVVEQWQAAGSSRTPFAKYINVDFETTDYEYFLDPQWSAKQAGGKVDVRTIWDRAQSDTNVIQSVKIVLKARKPFRGGPPWRDVGAFCLERHHGMGDVLMLLGVAKALKEQTGKPVFILTEEKLRGLVQSCPYVDGVLSAMDSFAAFEDRFRKMGGVKRVPLMKAKYGMSRGHQIDAYLAELGLTATPEQKEIVLDSSAGKPEADAFLAGLPRLRDEKKRILVHPARVDPNRTWPRAKWVDLVKRLSAQGHQVICIGDTTNAGKGAYALGITGVFSALDKLTYLGTLALMEASHILITTDSGVVQLAGASSIQIIGIYTVAATKSRAPFRKGVAGWGMTGATPTCPYYPCYQWMQDQEAINRVVGKFSNIHAEWCVAPSLYECLTDQISVDDILRSIYEIVRSPAVA